MQLYPCTVKAACKIVKQWHRHLPDLQGGLFAVSCISDGVIVGVGVAGNPSRVWQHEAKIVISRCATEGHENACSMIYGALARAAKALGYKEIWTYTLQDEPGTSLRASGFMDMGLTSGGEWSRPCRLRAAAKIAEPKRRWKRNL
ncbi:MAG TPA: XF1762 family protein [Candidatus Saccharimonadia bacterium]|nr:XF1762 family protein [Candidatus Saccharimonadia bacterium]